MVVLDNRFRYYVMIINFNEVIIFNNKCMRIDGNQGFMDGIFLTIQSKSLWVYYTMIYNLLEVGKRKYGAGDS